jgi:dTDP-4-amino-4,6-dideoxygalactose transaminase
MTYEILFNNPSIEGNEIEYMRAAIADGHSSARGPFSQRVARLLGDELGAADVLLTTSCTAALEMSALLLDIEPGDSVIVPSFTFVTTALAFARAGASLVFADIDPVTLGLDPRHVAELVDESTRAVVPVHYAGVGCDVDLLHDLVESEPRLDMVEDNAHGLFGTIRDRPLGSFGRFSTLSFHETKNFVCGEGGALVVNRASDVDRASTVYDKGTNRRAFLRGQVDKYTWVDTGSSFGLSDLLAAYLLGQLEQRNTILEKRRALWDGYFRNLQPQAESLRMALPAVPPDRQQSYHMFYVLLEDRETRDHALEELARRGFKGTFHYVPLHNAPGAKPFIRFETSCPVTEDVSGRLLRLPFYNNLAAADTDRIAECLLETLDRRNG